MGPLKEEGRTAWDTKVISNCFTDSTSEEVERNSSVPKFVQMTRHLKEVRQTLSEKETLKNINKFGENRGEWRESERKFDCLCNNLVKPVKTKHWTTVERNSIVSNCDWQDNYREKKLFQESDFDKSEIPIKVTEHILNRANDSLCLVPMKLFSSLPLSSEDALSVLHNIVYMPSSLCPTYLIYPVSLSSDFQNSSNSEFSIFLHLNCYQR